jgi:hypothetical protein
VLAALAVAVAATAAACDDIHLRTLTRADVSNLPAGTATGMVFSGQYIVTHNQVEACRCRVGSCTEIFGNVGLTLTATQTDGTLAIDSGTGAPAQGGVDSDGKFHVGFLIEQPGNVQYGLLDGTFMVGPGGPSWLTAVQQVTGNTGSFDCDVQTRVTASFVAPLTAASGPSPASPQPSVAHVPFGIADLSLGW